MRKYIYLILACVLVASLVLTGCEGSRSEVLDLENHLPDQEIKGITIENLPMDNEEYAILKAAGSDRALVFDVNLGKVQADRVHIWIDDYENGEKVGSLFGMESSIDQVHDNSFRLYLTTLAMGNGDEVWTLAFRQNGNVVSSKTELPKQDYDSAMTHPMTSITANPNETAVLGVIARNKGKDHMESSDDVDALIRDNQAVYVMRCMVYGD
ncbi:hypothetical protein [Paenibacillus barengoltzii]|uniref:Lipoprotein n=1 Tax=Paenibacillus barengoltzii G22 TaxID=1235795 RepID=R9LCJ1_9BACL|nr:hypothetical protein [Paenibacillus barengoltzii]EOS56504.1 hypothetical protein C812_02072 [Paenibacillus barengoltzii G22]